jgi:hypothetical protein
MDFSMMEKKIVCLVRVDASFVPATQIVLHVQLLLLMLEMEPADALLALIL